MLTKLLHSSLHNHAPEAYRKSIIGGRTSIKKKNSKLQYFNIRNI